MKETDMEAQEADNQAMVMIKRSKDQSFMTTKGKRTKRQKLTLTMVSSSSSGVEGDDDHHVVVAGAGGINSDPSGEYVSDGDRLAGAAASSSSSGTFAESTEEEEDMANCLILLAQGQTQRQAQRSSLKPSFSTDEKSRNYVYQCKTCERCFSSFQALGGHRASHKKPKMAQSEEKKPLLGTAVVNEVKPRTTVACTALSLQISGSSSTVVCGGGDSNNNNYNNNKSKIHECSICGAEFNSGQALGGHMRRHRPMPVSAAAANGGNGHEVLLSSTRDEKKKLKKNGLTLDLNLPAPEDDHQQQQKQHQESKFPTFPTSKQQVIVFSASPLVDCHY